MSRISMVVTRRHIICCFRVPVLGYIFAVFTLYSTVLLPIKRRNIVGFRRHPTPIGRRHDGARRNEEGGRKIMLKTVNRNITLKYYIYYIFFQTETPTTSAVLRHVFFIFCVHENRVCRYAVDCVCDYRPDVQTTFPGKFLGRMRPGQAAGPKRAQIIHN